MGKSKKANEAEKNKPCEVTGEDAESRLKVVFRLFSEAIPARDRGR
jgi:hypothetical protein